ncbi:hypothetical protein [Vibrio coralliirubri]|nr:hypothetical protein [Vibrio coralliirubri]
MNQTIINQFEAAAVQYSERILKVSTPLSNQAVSLKGTASDRLKVGEAL